MKQRDGATMLVPRSGRASEAAATERNIVPTYRDEAVGQTSGQSR
jgi:hypothetical protein